jgi:hypothetical protein
MLLQRLSKLRDYESDGNVPIDWIEGWVSLIQGMITKRAAAVTRLVWADYPKDSLEVKEYLPNLTILKGCGVGFFVGFGVACSKPERD